LNRKIEDFSTQKINSTRKKTPKHAFCAQHKTVSLKYQSRIRNETEIKVIHLVMLSASSSQRHERIIFLSKPFYFSSNISGYIALKIARLNRKKNLPLPAGRSFKWRSLFLFHSLSFDSFYHCLEQIYVFL
jgi:hypothetical protein